ncbi:hypothetical protein L1D15_19695 [Vibrio sp. Isolate25]|uniref:hypothetical protein n=1 Tax=Vibrio sp. Isolate25 TaxID=2908535 RepID=UPI001EFC868A|nr:hypothetical protein [Vibrio sp. Isolate25]MCG9598921.1 hypothetical protein [Vibrio sp. Isolate25]
MDGSVDDIANKLADTAQFFTRTIPEKIAVETARQGINYSNREEYLREEVRETTYNTTTQEGLLDTKTGYVFSTGNKKDHDLKVVVEKVEKTDVTVRPAGTKETSSNMDLGSYD